MLMQEQLLNYLKKLTNVDDIKLEIPPKKELWDFAFPTFPLAKTFRKNPNQIAQELVEKINKDKPSFIEKVEQVGPYINFFLSKDTYNDLFKKILEEKIEDEENKSKTIFIDYIGANVWKPLHIGHMCTPNLGQAIINTYKRLWYNVVSDSHIGDWGIIFWKLIVAYQNWGNEEKLKENAVDHLLELYIKATAEEEKDSSWNDKFQQAFKKLSSGDKDYIKYWEMFTKESIQAMNKQLAKLNVKPDYNIWESFYEWLALPKLEDYPDLIWSMKDITKELIEKKIATKNEDGSVGVIFENNKYPSTILQKRNGTFGYLASDLAAVKYRVHYWKPEKIIYFVDKRQTQHLQWVFEISKLAGWTKDSNLYHAANGFISLKDGAMSTRKGKIIKLQALLDEAKNRAKQIILEKREDLDKKELESLSEIIWIWAIKYEYLRKNRELDVVFDWDEFMTFEWNSAPYIMYSYVRWLSILEKNGLDFLDNINNYNFTKQEEFDLIKKLSEYKEVLKQTAEKAYPHILANYTYELTKLFNNFYNNVSVNNESDLEKKKSRLALVKKFTETLKDSFDILAIKLPERM